MTVKREMVVEAFFKAYTQARDILPELPPWHQLTPRQHRAMDTFCEVLIREAWQLIKGDL